MSRRKLRTLAAPLLCLPPSCFRSRKWDLTQRLMMKTNWGLRACATLARPNGDALGGFHSSRVCGVCYDETKTQRYVDLCRTRSMSDNHLSSTTSSLNTPCPHCGHSITPEERTHVDTEHLKCPSCGKLFVPGSGSRNT